MNIKRAAFNRGFEEAPPTPFPRPPIIAITRGGTQSSAKVSSSFSSSSSSPSPPPRTVVTSDDKRKKSNNFRENFAVYSARSRERLCAHTDPAGEAALETPSRVKTVVVSWLNIFASCVRTPRDRAGLFRAPIQTNPYEPITPRFHRTSPRVHAG